MSQQVNSSIKPSNDKFVLANKCENTGMSFPMHHHSEYEFYYVLEGEGRLFWTTQFILLSLDCSAYFPLTMDILFAFLQTFHIGESPSIFPNFIFPKLRY